MREARNETLPPPLADACRASELLVRREVVRLRTRYQLSQQELSGHFISDDQVDAMLRRRAEPLGWDALQAQVALDVPRMLRGLVDHQPWARMVAQIRLDAFEQLAVLLAFLPVLDAKYLPLYAYLNDDLTRRHVTSGLVRRMAQNVCPASQAQAMASLAKLCRMGLLDQVDREPGLPASVEAGLRISDVLAAHLLEVSLADSLAWPGVVVTRPGFSEWAQLPVPPQFANELLAAQHAMPRHPVLLIGAEGSGCGAAARNMLAAHGALVVEVDCAVIAADDIPRLALAAQLAQASLLLRKLGPGFLPDQAAQFRATCLPLAVVAAEGALARRLFPGAIECEAPTSSVVDRQQMWTWHLARHKLAAPQHDLAEAADLFALSPRDIENAVGSYAAAVRAGLAGQDRESLLRVARNGSRAGFSAHAERVEDGYRLDDLVVPKAIRGRIEDFIGACRNRRKVYEEWGMQRRLGPARGLAALFSGSSGTGKSMAASAISKELSLDLYRIELSGIVSKYIGETEKNLDAVFAAARAANCILFFDEADALFGKRSDVKDAHDRYANIECAYLLQKMERHDGLVILTTNMPRSLDPAFSRRIQFVIEFARPDEVLRECLWRGMFPESVPFAEDIDFAFLARNFDVTGGEIRNIALDAALQAACVDQGGAGVTMLGILKAVERQMIKQGRAPTAAAFKQHFQPLREAAR